MKRQSLGLAVIGVVVVIAVLTLILTQPRKEGLTPADCGKSKVQGHEKESLLAGHHCCPDWTFAQDNHCETYDGCKVHKDGIVYDCPSKPKRVGKTLFMCNDSNHRIYAKSKEVADAMCTRYSRTQGLTPAQAQAQAQAAGILEGAVLGATLEHVQQEQQQQAQKKCTDSKHVWYQPQHGPGKCLSITGDFPSLTALTGPQNTKPLNTGGAGKPSNGAYVPQRATTNQHVPDGMPPVHKNTRHPGKHQGGNAASEAQVQLCAAQHGTQKGNTCYTWGYCAAKNKDPVYANGVVTGCKPKTVSPDKPNIPLNVGTAN